MTVDERHDPHQLDDPSSGAGRAPESRELTDVTGHSNYLAPDSISQYNMSVIVAGSKTRPSQWRGPVSWEPNYPVHASDNMTTTVPLRARSVTGTLGVSDADGRRRRQLPRCRPAGHVRRRHGISRAISKRRTPGLCGCRQAAALVEPKLP